MDTQFKLSRITAAVKNLERDFPNLDRNDWIIVITDKLYMELFNNQENQFMGIEFAIEDAESDNFAIVPKNMIYNSTIN